MTCIYLQVSASKVEIASPPNANIFNSVIIYLCCYSIYLYVHIYVKTMLVW